MQKSYRVFYIEDNLENRVLLERFLKFEGFAVTSVETGQEGLNRAGEIKPDIFIVDIHLPDMSGYEVIKQLHAQVALQHIPKVAFSASSAYQARQCLPDGPIFFLAKPINVDTLGDKIRRAIQYQEHAMLFEL